MMRRPPDSDMPRQLRKLSSISLCVGIVVIVLSKFWIFTVCKAMSTTSPSAPNCGASIQSPTRIMSLEVSWTDATSDRIVSLNTSISTAAIAPRPDSSSSGDCSISAATIRIAAAK
jgi:hypothetical protein